MKNTALSPVQNVGLSQVQNNQVATASKKFGLKAKEAAVLAMLVGMSAMSVNANAAGTEFSLDVSSIISGIATLVTLVTSIGLAFLSVVLVIKAFKYIKSAM